MKKKRNNVVQTVSEEQRKATAWAALTLAAKGYELDSVEDHPGFWDIETDEGWYPMVDWRDLVDLAKKLPYRNKKDGAT